MDVMRFAQFSLRKANRPCRVAEVSAPRAGREASLVAEALESRTLLTATFQEFNSFPGAQPELGNNPASIVRGPTGDLWYTARGSNRIVKFSPTAPQVSPPTSETPQGLTIDESTGVLWYTAQNANKIGRFDPATNLIQEFNLPTPSSFPTNITVGPDGMIWFTSQATNRIGRLNPGTGQITEFNVPTANSSPFAIMAGPDGNIWFTLFNSSRIGRLVPATGQITEFATPTPNSGPLGIATGTDGQIWFTQFNSDKIGRLNPSTGVIQEFALPRPANATPGVIAIGPQGIAAAPGGVMYYTGSVSGKIGRITSTGSVQEFTPLTPGGRPTSIIFGNDGAMWFTQFDVRKIGRVVYTPNTPSNGDFDGDRKADLAVFRPSTTQWLVRLSGGGVLRDPATNTLPVFGAADLADIPIAADFDGDGKADIGVFRPTTSQWLVKLSGGGILRDPSTNASPQFGASGLLDLPVPADYDGDGKADIAVFRTSTAEWFVILSGGGGILLDPATGRAPQFGAANLVDLPVPGDYDGDGKADLAVFRPATAQWLVRLSGGGILRDPNTNGIPQFGAPNLVDLPVAGDFDGDGKTDLAVFRPATSQWLVKLSGGGILRDPNTNTLPQFGAPNLLDLPVQSPIAALVRLGLVGPGGKVNSMGRASAMASRTSSPSVTIPLVATTQSSPDLIPFGNTLREPRARRIL